MSYYRIKRKEIYKMKLTIVENKAVEKEINKRLRDLGVSIKVKEIIVENKTTVKLELSGEDTVRLLKNI